MLIMGTHPSRRDTEVSLNAIQNFLSQIGTRRMFMMGGVALALLAMLGFLAMRGTGSDLDYLYTDLDPSAAQSIATKLAAQGVQYQVSGDGSAILAPREQLAQLRMSMAGEQVGGKIGYEVLDSATPFGLSAAREKIDETRAVEGELARSISTLESVSSARVHIVMPERAVFSTETRKATAGVTLRTRGPISAENIQAIRYLVSSSVPELSPESVSIIDQTGRLLARAGESGAAQSDEVQVTTEARLREQIESLLEPIVGMGKVRAEVSAEINRDQVREESQTFDPDKQVIAHQISVESGDRSQESDAGAQGATVSNQLPDATGANAAGGGAGRASNSNQTSEDTTYDNSRTNVVKVSQPGAIKRLTVAVMVDGGAKGLPTPQVQRITRLVQNAVGFNAERGDSVAVESMAFSQPEEVSDVSSMLSKLPMDHIFTLLKLLVIGGVGLFALRIMKNRGGADAAADPKLLAAQDGVVAALPGAEAISPGLPGAAPMAAIGNDGPSHMAQLDHEIALAQVEGGIKASSLRRLGDTITANPAESVSVIRQWMNA